MAVHLITDRVVSPDLQVVFIGLRQRRLRSGKRRREDEDEKRKEKRKERSDGSSEEQWSRPSTNSRL